MSMCHVGTAGSGVVVVVVVSGGVEATGGFEYTGATDGGEDGAEYGTEAGAEYGTEAGAEAAGAE